MTERTWAVVIGILLAVSLYGWWRTENVCDCWGGCGYRIIPAHCIEDKLRRAGG